MKKKSKILYFLQEVAIVVSGVLIAVVIGNYKEKSDDQKYLKKTLLAIESEVYQSKNDLDTVVSKHLKLLNSLEEEIGENEQMLGDMIAQLGGIQVASIKNISLRFFVSNKAELLDFELISQLLEIEDISKILSEKIRRMTDYTYEHLNDNDDEAKRTFAFLLSDVVESEQSLLEAYSSFLKENK